MSRLGEDGSPPSTRAAKLGYLPALDGLRGACLLAVLLFHSGFGWMSGGFLGVSTFFTLSGYLITTLLLAERASAGAISLRRFWERRLRRLLPAALLTIAAIVATQRFWLAPAQQQHVAEDALATLFYVVNWRFMSPEYAYNLIFTDPSPFQHFWSLAIEGQFYLLFPLLVALVLRLGGGTRGVALACAAATVASIAVSLSLPSLAEAQHRLYYGTDARAGELLIGALLAIAQRSARAPSSAPSSSTLRRAAPLAGLLILAAWTCAGVGDAWLYRGGFAAYAVLSATVIAAATLPDGIVRGVLATEWLRWVGTVSYGAYLYHWPVFLVLTPVWTGLAPLPLLAVRLAATLLVAGFSYRFVERPVRSAGLLPGRRFAWASAAALLLVATLAIASDPFTIAVRTIIAVQDLRRSLTRDDGTTARGLRFAMFGDSTALSLWNGLASWLGSNGDARVVRGSDKLGCGLFLFGQMENRGEWVPENPECLGMVERWKSIARDSKPDVAVILVGPWEARNRRRTETSPSLRLGDPELDAATRDAIVAALDAFAATGTAVVWLTSPHIKVPPLDGQTFASDLATSEPERIDRINELIRDVARTRPESVRVVELGAYLQHRPNGEFDHTIRADDVHFSIPGATEVARDWLGAEVVRAARELRLDGPRGAPAAPAPAATKAS